MDNLFLINRRRQEITDELTRLDKRRSDMERELRELDIAERVLARLSGAERPETGTRDERQPEKASGAKPEDIPTMPQMITEALRWGPPTGMEPKEVRDWIAQHYWPEVKGDKVSSILWRMWHRQQVQKEDARYRLPRSLISEGYGAADANAGERSSAAPQLNPDAQGREAVPGGGT